MKVVKRDGRVVDYDPNKIINAINAACSATEGETITYHEISTIWKYIVDQNNEQMTVEEIQDIVEKQLMEKGYYKIAKSYILYREQRRKARNIKESLIDYKKVIGDYVRSDDWRVKENASVSYSLGGLILSNSGAVTANYWLTEIYPKDIADAHRNCDIHLHDLSMLSPYCAGHSLRQLIMEGLGGVEGKIASKPAAHLNTLCNQMVNFLGILQNEWAGAQAFSSFDTYLAPFVKADNLSYREVKQAIQSFVFGINTPSRWGCVDTETEILTVNGFKRYDEVQRGEFVYTWNNGQLELNPINEVIIKHHEGKMHSYRNGSYHQFVTPDHRVLYKKHNADEYDIKHSDEIFYAGTPYYFPAQFKTTTLQSDTSLCIEAVQMAAILYCDGSIYKKSENSGRVTIYKSPNRMGHELIKYVADILGLKFSQSEIVGGFNSVVNKYNFYGDDAKFLENLIESRHRIADRFLNLGTHQSIVFLQTWAMFDGQFEKGLLQYDNEEIGDQLQHIALRAGYTSYKYRHNNSTYIKIREVENVQPTNRDEFDYSGIVWCVNVNNGTVVFRRDGNTFITGNCQAPFSNITLDWTVPEDLAELPAIVGGKEMDFKYKDCKKEMDMINKAFIEVMVEGDANGRGHAYPIKNCISVA